jgi:hypothetical protein
MTIDIATDHRQQKRVGLLAGGGKFPITFARAAKEQGHEVCAIGVLGMVSPDLAAECDTFATAPLSRIGKAIRFFKRAGVDHVVMAGKIEKTVIFQPLRFLRLIPDWRAIHMICCYLRKNRTDDSILLAVIREFERDNIKFLSALDYCPEILVEHGFLTRRKPSPTQWHDVRFGWEMAKEMGRLDVGQTVIVDDTVVLAVEAIEGTDKAIRRAGGLCQRGGFTVVKVAKPQQDMRFDVPTIGVDTIRAIHEAGGRVLAIEAGKTIILERDEVVNLANKLGIAIVSLNADELKLRAAS